VVLFLGSGSFHWPASGDDDGERGYPVYLHPQAFTLLNTYENAVERIPPGQTQVMAIVRREEGRTDEESPKFDQQSCF